MKIWRKSTLAALFLFCTMFFALSMTAAAEEVGGVWKKDEVYGKIDVSWSYDTETKTLTISGTGAYSDPKVSVPWQEYVKDVDILIVNGDAVSYCRPKKRVVANVKDGFQWIYDIKAKTIVFSHQGESPEKFPDMRYVDGQILNHIDLVTVEDGITSIDGVFDSNKKIDTIVFGKDVQAPSERTIEVQTRYIVSEDNPWITAYDNCLYTKDYQRLIGCPLNKENIKFPQGVKIIGERAFGQCRFKELIIPWGVTTLEPSSIIIYSPANPYPPEGEPIPKVILPDTILVNKVIFSERTSYLHFYYSKNNKVMDEALAGLTRQYDRDFYFGVKLDSVAEYYPEATAIKTGWQEENGKKFYYNANGQKVSGWQKIGAAWYWFAADGGMGQNIWVKDQGKWYYLKADGVMATNQWVADQGNYWVSGSGIMVSNNWIQVKGSWYYLLGNGLRAENRWVYARDKKWYYLGKGGVMLANTTTPDGYRVDKNGAWVR